MKIIDKITNLAARNGVLFFVACLLAIVFGLLMLVSIIIGSVFKMIGLIFDIVGKLLMFDDDSAIKTIRESVFKCGNDEEEY